MNVPSSNVRIALEQVQFLSGGTEGLATALAAAVNWIIDNVANPPIGSVVFSMLDEVAFAAAKNTPVWDNLFPTATTWIVADGRSVTGSAFDTMGLGTNVPDARATFLRGKNNGRVDGKENPDGELALGAFSTNKILQHSHSNTYSNFAQAGRLDVAKTDGTFDQETGPNRYTKTGSVARFNPTVEISTAGVDSISTPDMVVSNEERPYCAVLNCFVRVN